ncbi:hypothetical protein Pcinc_039353 [Petrolisthes cinctipes]|uniref:Glutamine-dependent NAD(+) synthetase n=1 Tax=Petrolisthes cinctipes TaxID=88211 RepID=A0AAE1BPJ9_PETCI|nr:hypothetical protein Pcinc_039353 [Petrolisthes cinctipes]
MAVLSTCALSQWALDYRGNYERIIESIQEAKAAGSRYRCGSELDITGYGCGDHHLEIDTLQQAWKVVASLLQHPACSDIMVDVGLPVMHKNIIYNCRLVFCNRKVLLVRPKMMLANDTHMGYQETRWFTAWRKPRVVEELSLPSFITDIAGQETVPFGDAILVARDTVIGIEICEELWNPQSPHVPMGLDGVEIVCNSSASLQELGRTDIAYTLVRSATLKSGGCYLYANQHGCDGNIGYFSGDACISVNGDIVGAAPLYSLLPVRVVTATVDLDAIATFRNSIRSRCDISDTAPTYPRVKVDFWLCGMDNSGARLPPCPSLPQEPSLPSLGQQVLEGAAVWAWDVVRRAGRPGLLLPLDGQLASSVSAIILATMCHKLVQHATDGHTQVVEEVQEIVREVGYVPSDAQELCSRLVCSLHLTQPSDAQHSAKLARELARVIGSNHKTAEVKKGVAALKEAFTSADNDKEDGTDGEVDGDFDAADQNANDKFSTSNEEEQALTHLHSRLRMSLIYYFSEAGWWGNGKQRAGQLLVLGSSPAHTASSVKFGDSYGDINLVGSFSNRMLRQALLYARHELNLPIVDEILSSASLTKEDAKDEEAREIVAKELLGPDSLSARLLHLNENQSTPHQVEERVKGLFSVWGERRLQEAGIGGVPRCYLPGIGASSPDRPIIYPPHWSSPFSTIEPWWRSHRKELRKGITEWCQNQSDSQDLE